MIKLRKAADRGHFNHGWLDTHHTFSFGEYQDPEYMQFRSLRVVNEDRVVGGAGFPLHGHRDMEIVTYVVSGALEHRDSLGNGSVLRAGDLQRMSAGTGIRHSEFNHSQTEPLHFYQIWIMPAEKGTEPGYQETSLGDVPSGTWQTVASGADTGAGLGLNQDATISVVALESGQTVRRDIAPQRHLWVQIMEGNVTLNGQALEAGDGAAVSDEAHISLETESAGRVLVLDLA